MKHFLKITGQTTGIVIVHRGNAKSPMPFQYDVYQDGELVGGIIINDPNTPEHRLGAGSKAKLIAERDFV